MLHDEDLAGHITVEILTLLDIVNFGILVTKWVNVIGVPSCSTTTSNVPELFRVLEPLTQETKVLPLFFHHGNAIVHFLIERLSSGVFD